MQNKNVGKPCESTECDYNIPFMRPHVHVRTPDGTYVKFIVDKPKTRVIKEYVYADPR